MNSNIYEIFKNKGYSYNPITGEIKNSKGGVCRKKHTGGYIYLSSTNNKKQIYAYAHRFAWFLYYGSISNNLVVDHIDRDKTNNRIDNLRLITKQKNHFNTEAKGCYFSKKDKIWIAKIVIDQKSIHLGCYINENDAHQAYLDAKKIYHII